MADPFEVVPGSFISLLLLFWVCKWAFEIEFFCFFELEMELGPISIYTVYTQHLVHLHSTQLDYNTKVQNTKLNKIVNKALNLTHLTCMEF